MNEIKILKVNLVMQLHLIKQIIKVIQEKI